MIESTKKRIKLLEIYIQKIIYRLKLMKVIGRNGKKDAVVYDVNEKQRGIFS